MREEFARDAGKAYSLVSRKFLELVASRSLHQKDAAVEMHDHMDLSWTAARQT